MISIHAAQEGCDWAAMRQLQTSLFISIHAAQEGCDAEAVLLPLPIFISIHAAQEGCDFVLRAGRYNGSKHFNPRSPRGLRLPKTVCRRFYAMISIHAAQEGCDQIVPVTVCVVIDFNPRSPRGLRQRWDFIGVKHFEFQSTQPKRAATV